MAATRTNRPRLTGALEGVTSRPDRSSERRRALGLHAFCERHIYRAQDFLQPIVSAEEELLELGAVGVIELGQHGVPSGAEVLAQLSHVRLWKLDPHLAPPDGGRS